MAIYVNGIMILTNAINNIMTNTISSANIRVACIGVAFRHMEAIRCLATSSFFMVNQRAFDTDQNL